MMNISEYNNETTAKTCIECANQRAENLYLLGVKSVLELCVGPSLQILETAYKKYNIKVTGNDIDIRWKRFYPNGKWIIDDALNVDYNNFNAVVFAPPLTKGCSGKRNDALSIDNVFPSYLNFLKLRKNNLSIITLPARSMATKLDRKQFYNLTSKINFKFDLFPLTSGIRKIIKYYDLLIYGEKL